MIKTVIQASKGKKKAQTKPPATTSTTTSDEKQARAEEGEGEGSPISAAAAATVTAVALASAAAAEEEGEGEGDAPMPLTNREVAQEIYDRAGVKGFYGGVQYAALQSALDKSIYFYAYSTMKGITKLLNGGRYGGRGGREGGREGGRVGRKGSSADEGINDDYQPTTVLLVSLFTGLACGRT